MIKSLTVLAVFVAFTFADSPPTELSDHEKVQMWEQLASVNKLMQEQQALQSKIQVAAKVWEEALDHKRKDHNAVGCSIDVNVMKWTTCTPPDKGAPKK